MLKLALCARFFCYYLVLRGSFASIGCPVVLPMAKFFNVGNKENWTGPGLKWALKEKLEDIAVLYGGVAQYLNARFATAEQRELLRGKLMDFAPRRSDKQYLPPPATGNPPVVSAGCIHIADLGF